MNSASFSTYDNARLAALNSVNLIDTERFERQTRLATRLLGLPVAFIGFFKGDHLCLKACQGWDTVELPAGLNLWSQTLQAENTFDASPLPVEIGLNAGEGLAFQAFIGAPLKFNGQPVGIFGLFDYHPREFTEDDRLALLDLAALVNDELAGKTLKEPVQSGELLATLHQTALSLMSRLDLDELLATLLGRAGQLVGTEHGFIALVEPDDNTIRVRVKVGYFKDKVLPDLKKGEGLAGIVWDTGQPITISDYASWEKRVPKSFYDQVHAMVQLPLATTSEFIGVLALAHLDENVVFSPEQINTLLQYAHIASLALYNARLDAEMQQRLSDLDTIQRLARVINSSLGLDQVFKAVVNEINTAFDYEMVSIYLLEPDGLHLQAATGYSSVIDLIRLGQGVSGRVARTGEAAFVRNASQDSDFLEAMPGIWQAIICPLKSSEGKVLGTLSVETRTQKPLSDADLTLISLVADQVSVAVENSKLLDRLEQQEEMYRDVVSNVNEIIGQTDATGYWTFLNNSWEQILGYSQEGSLDSFFLDYIHPDDRQLAWSKMEPLLKGQLQRCQVELRFLASDKKPRYVQFNGRVMLNPQGAVTGATITIINLTEHKLLEEEKLQLEKKLWEAQKLESLGVLAGGVAHDFNNLLVAILGNTELAMLDTDPESSLYSILNEIELASRRAADLTGQMLAYSGRGRFVTRQLDINSVFLEMSHLLKAVISKKVVLSLDLDPNLPLVDGDPTQVRQVIMNLIVNASDAISGKDKNSQREGVITITTGAVSADRDLFKDAYLSAGQTEGRYVFFEISDTGCGMDAATQARIFEPFFSTKFTGRGLGLSSVLGIVRSHKGAIKLASKVDHGTTFQIFLPALADKNNRLEIPSGESNRWQTPVATVGQRTILIIDDETMVRKTIVKALETIGCRLLEAGDGRSGIELFRQHATEIDCILLDVTMPDLNGEQVLEALTEIRPDLCVLIMSGYSEHEIGERFKGHEKLDFIQKPFRVGELTEKVRKLLTSSTKK